MCGRVTVPSLSRAKMSVQSTQQSSTAKELRGLATSQSTPAESVKATCPLGGATLFTRITDSPAKCPFDGAQHLSSKPTDYQPWQGAPFDLQTGLQPLGNPEELYEIDEHYIEEMEERRQLLRCRGSEVLASTSEAGDANLELLESMAAILPKQYPDRFLREGSVLRNIATAESFDLRDPALDPLKTASSLVQEDLALMKEDARSGQYKLVSGAILFPMRWSLLQKMNRRLSVIHGPVPFYREKLRDPVDEFMTSLSSEMPYWRANFSVTDQPALHQALTEKDIFAAKNDRLESLQRGHITLEDAPDRLFMRCERQTLSRLPKSGAVLFTIRTYVRPLREYLSKPTETLLRLRQSVEAMPEIWVNYKTMQGVKDITLQLLDKHLAA